MKETPRIKRIATALLSKLPTWPSSLILSEALNQVLKPLINDGSLSPFNGKSVRVIVEDFGLQFSFSLRGSRFTPISSQELPDLSIRSTLSDFYLLAIRQEDPDTLFFNRELEITGDTELGLMVKNMLDAVEWPSLPKLPLLSR